ncbi:response regulator [Mucilaginibacter sp.]|uniref:response regulator n=1 Tax=Mucilaginibacter sp. TaxID=1882438 RepID=UPI003B00603F
MQQLKKQILVVDDDLSILKLLNFILSKDYEVVMKSSGIEAFAWLEEGHYPELIISDLEMPYFDGTSFIRNLKISGFYRDTPVIVLSGTDDVRQQVENMSFAVEGYLNKPFNPAGLKDTIQQVFNMIKTA